VRIPSASSTPIGRSRSRGAARSSISPEPRLAGEESPDRDFDADEGAVLVKPREILGVGPVDFDRIERIRRELGNPPV